MVATNGIKKIVIHKYGRVQQVQQCKVESSVKKFETRVYSQAVRWYFELNANQCWGSFENFASSQLLHAGRS